MVTLGYHGMPEATAEAFRDGWFHTGDLGRLDADGWLYFQGRKKDAIRRRGENISAFEIEEVVEAHPAVLQAAAFGISSDLMEEEVKVCAVLRPGFSLGPEELVAWCEGRMARHMVASLSCWPSCSAHQAQCSNTVALGSASSRARNAASSSDPMRRG